jgi:hypothetical protein
MLSRVMVLGRLWLGKRSIGYWVVVPTPKPFENYPVFGMGHFLSRDLYQSMALVSLETQRGRVWWQCFVGICGMGILGQYHSLLGVILYTR